MMKEAFSNVFAEQARGPVALKSVTKPIVYGFAWLNGISFLSAILSFIQVVIIAQVLDPHLVGLVAVFYIIQGALDSFTATGFGKAIIQWREIEQHHVNTAFVTHLSRGLLLAVAVFLSAPLIVRLLNASEAQYVVQIMAITLVFQGARNPGALFFMRQLTFYKQFIWHASGALVRFATTVTLLYILKNEWAIVYGVLFHEVVMLLLSFLLIDIRPGFQWDRTVFRSLFNYGKWVLFASIVAAIERQGNQIATVKLLGEASLGVLFLGLRIASLSTVVTQQLKNVLFPVFSRLQDSFEEMKKLYQHSIGIVALFIFPVAGCAIVFAEPFTQLFLKTTWTQVAEILGLLACAQAIQAICTIGISLFNAKGIPKLAFYNRLIQGSIILIAIYPLAKSLGIQGVAVLYIINSAASFLFCSGSLVRYLHFDIRVFAILLFPLFGTTVTSILFYLGNRIVLVNSIPILFASVIAFFAFYFLLAFGSEMIISKNDPKTSVSAFSTMKSVKEIVMRKGNIMSI
jgi:O-antigen/teichoic acid export membrane protein